MTISRYARVNRHEGGAFVMNIASDRCFGLNATGAAVLSCLEKGVTDPAVIAESLAANAQENGIEVELDRVFSDVSAFLEALKAAGILE